MEMLRKGGPSRMCFPDWERSSSRLQDLVLSPEGNLACNKKALQPFGPLVVRAFFKTVISAV